MRHSEQRDYEDPQAHTKKLPRGRRRLVLPPRKESSTMKSAAAAILLFSALTTGCVNSSTLQTAKALDPGSQRILVGGGFYTSPSVNADASQSTSSDVSLAMPYMELGYRRGIVDKVELGAKVTVPGTAGVDAKYQFLQKGKLAMAAGLGGGYLKISSGSDGMQTSTQLIDTI